MATKQTHIFKTVGSLSLKVDIFTRSSPTYDPKQPIVLFLHGGGFVVFDRASLPPHIVQSCLSRNWPLISADYRKLPQTNGKEVLQDVKDAYQVVVEKVPELFGGGKEERCEKVIVLGQSAGTFLLSSIRKRIHKRMKTDERNRAYMSLLCGHYMTPRPVAILTYHSMPTISAPYFNSSKILGPPGAKPMLQSQIQAFLDEPPTVGSTPAARAFNPACLS
jgi:acetyl esterase/lipase